MSLFLLNSGIKKNDNLSETKFIKSLSKDSRLLVLKNEHSEIEKKFGFLLNALSAGAPPHGGIALGMDRIVQRFTNSQSLRDTVAFPKTTAARALFEGAPTLPSGSSLQDLGLQVKAQDPLERAEEEE